MRKVLITIKSDYKYVATNILECLQLKQCNLYVFRYLLSYILF